MKSFAHVLLFVWLALAYGCASSVAHQNEARAVPFPPCTHNPSADTAVYELRQVTDTPLVVRGPALEYPEYLFRLHVEGKVMIDAIISPQGRAEPNSMTIVHSDHSAFGPPSLEYLRKAEFRPGCYGGQAVRVHITFPVTFRIKDA